MNKQMYWGIAALIILLVGATVFVVVKNQSEMRQHQKELAEIQKQAEVHDKPTQPIADNRPPPPGETKESGYWHGDHWHRFDEPDTQHGDVVTPPVTAAQKAEWVKFWKELGLDPPPKGHGYEFDGEGNATLFKYNEPRFKKRWSKKEYPATDFTKLTETEWIRYHALRHIMGGSLLRIEGEMLQRLHRGETLPNATYAPGVQELAEDWLIELEHKASGATPYVSTKTNWDHEPTPEELAEVERQEHELLLSMQRPERPRPEWQPYVESIVKELEAAIAAE